MKRVDVFEDGLELRLTADGPRSLVTELSPEPEPYESVTNSESTTETASDPTATGARRA